MLLRFSASVPFSKSSTTFSRLKIIIPHATPLTLYYISPSPSFSFLSLPLSLPLHEIQSYRLALKSHPFSSESHDRHHRRQNSRKTSFFFISEEISSRLPRHRLLLLLLADVRRVENVGACVCVCVREFMH